MLVAISGSQGTGKTTVLNEIKRLGYNTIDRKTSRSILSDWNVTLEEVNNDRELTLQFQLEIIGRKYQDELSAANSSDVWFTERTYADLFTYALISLGKDNTNSDWLNSYFDTCVQYQQSYASVFYLESGKFKVVSDGVRGSNQHYSRMVDLVMRDYTRKMTKLTDVWFIETPDNKERVEIILDPRYNVAIEK